MHTLGYCISLNTCACLCFLLKQKEMAPGTNACLCPHPHHTECNLGNLITDAYVHFFFKYGSA